MERLYILCEIVDLYSMLYGTLQVNGRGRRIPSTEDRVCIQHLPEENCDIFAVFDGHSGPEVAEITKGLLYKRIQAALKTSGSTPEEMAAMLARQFIAHNKYLASPEVFHTINDSGSTATLALVTPTHCIVAYIGDSPCFLMNPENGTIISQIGKHEPSLATETARIKAAGGFVEVDEGGTARVDGMLAVARAFGDFSFNTMKGGGLPPEDADWIKMKVTSHPDVVIWERPAKGLLAIMSDGLVETNGDTLKPLEQVAYDIYSGLALNNNLGACVKHVLQKHVEDSVRGTRRRYDGDDLSLILVDVGRGGEVSQEGGSSHVASMVENKAPTRKAKLRRKKTAKKNRLIKIFSC
jgi:serine/threonine protein phosphatase PrpC